MTELEALAEAARREALNDRNISLEELAAFYRAFADSLSKCFVAIVENKNKFTVFNDFYRGAERGALNPQPPREVFKKLITVLETEAVGMERIAKVREEIERKHKHLDYAMGNVCLIARSLRQNLMHVVNVLSNAEKMKNYSDAVKFFHFFRDDVINQFVKEADNTIVILNTDASKQSVIAAIKISIQDASKLQL